MGVRRCSECGKTGHNARTCSRRRIVKSNGGSVKVFGVHLHRSVPSRYDDEDGDFWLMKKSFSLQELSCPAEENSHKLTSGYISDGLIGRTHEKMNKKGVPWTQEEHELFLLGMQKLGRGHWKGISKIFVPTRTSTQVASHAQKYFLRLNDATIKRCSLTHLGTAGRHEAAFQREAHKKQSSNSSHVLVPASCKLIFDNNYISQHKHSPNLELTLAGPTRG